ncbi:serine protease HtrA [Clostridiisalibacter paucivorans]|uniref:serine protease HtrA n=1 Tax=Clostridiisalibacter paucivorans TaxID=408753 RepID=UPI000A00CC4D|nr:trypsin-like peptidase domain-containing protein [Clostridiisalibacter paucivorans]
MNNNWEDNGSPYYMEEPPINKKPRKKRGLFSYFIVALIGALVGGILSVYIAPNYLYGNIIPLPQIYKGNTVIEGQKINISPKDDLTIATAVAKKAVKTVVGITTLETQVDIFFGPRQLQGVGSGLIIDSKGYILTNSHVVGDGNAEKITVQFENGDKKPAEVIWNDIALDLAIIKVNASNLPVAELGDSDNLQVGEVAIAIGNPLGLQFQRTVTSGIISGLERTIRDQNIMMEDLIQTDASINPGNSGGPLLDAEGKVIGVNTAKITSAEGLGFAVPINVAKTIIDQVINEGKVTTVYLGIRGVEVEKYEKALGVELTADEGIILIEIIKDSPAHKAGIKPGDVLKSIDGKEVLDMNTLRPVLYKYRPGDKAKVKLMRNGENIELEIEFERKPEGY